MRKSRDSAGAGGGWRAWWRERTWMVWAVVGFAALVCVGAWLGHTETAGALTDAVEGWQEINRSMP